MSNSDGMKFAPVGKPAPVCNPGDFCFAAAGLDQAIALSVNVAVVKGGSGEGKVARVAYRRRFSHRCESHSIRF